MSLWSPYYWVDRLLLSIRLLLIRVAKQEQRHRLVRQLVASVSSPTNHVKPLIVEALSTLVGDSDIAVSSHAALGLASICHPQALLPLLNMLKAGTLVKTRDSDVVHIIDTYWKGPHGLKQPLPQETIEGLSRFAMEGSLQTSSTLVMSSTAFLLRASGWMPSTDKERLRFAILTANSDYLIEQGPSAIDAMIEAFSQDADLGHKIWLCRTLGEIRNERATTFLLAQLERAEAHGLILDAAAVGLGGLRDCRIIDPLVRRLFAQSTGHDWQEAVQKVLLAMVQCSDLTPELVDVIMSVSTVKLRWHSLGDEGLTTVSLDASDSALVKLCKDKSRLSSNLLHLVAGKEDVELGTDPVQAVEGVYPRPGREIDKPRNFVSFARQRRLAGEELRARGNPQYLEGAYCNKGDSS